MAAPQTRLTLSIPNRVEALAEGMNAVEAYLAAWSVDPSDIAQVMIILDEVASNIIKSAWPCGEEHCFHVDLEIEPSSSTLRLRLCAMDDGVAFDPTGVPPPSTLHFDLDSREPGGLGLFLVSQMSDSMQYHRVGGQNCLQITKQLQKL